VASEKQQELLICFSADISPVNKVGVSDKPYQLNLDFLREDHLIVKEKKIRHMHVHMQWLWCWQIQPV